MLPKRSIKTIALTPLPYKFTLNEVIPMTPKQQLLLQIETLPDPIIEELLDFLLITLIRHHRQQQTSLPLG